MELTAENAETAEDSNVQKVGPVPSGDHLLAARMQAARGCRQKPLGSSK